MSQPIIVTRTISASDESGLPVVGGLIAGIAGSLGIMVAVTAILIAGGRDIWTAVRLIASFVYGPNTGTGAGPIIVGTVLHMVTGGVLGMLFARIVPPLRRAFWIVVGLIYSIGAWVISSFLVLPLVAPLLVATDVNINVLLFAHVVYGFILGSAAATYGVIWRIPKRLR